MDSAFPRFSFGCEFEFLVAYLPSWKDDPQAGSPGLAPLLRIDKESSSEKSDEIIAHMRQTLRSHGIKVYNPPGLTDDPTENNGEFDVIDPTVPRRLQHTDKWDITFDISVGETELPMYSWECMEVRSPVFLDRESADREIAYVLNLIKASYRVRVNSSTGFHVHVGNGAEWLPFETLSRLGALTWAADPLLSRLHAPWRRVNHYSNSIRYASNLACFGHVPDSHMAAVRPKGAPGQNDDENQPLLADELLYELPEWIPKDDKPEDDTNADPIEMVPEGTEGSETFKITNEQARWLVDYLPDLETRTAFLQKCIEIFSHWDVHLLEGDELYTVLLECAPGIENGEVILPWSDILQQWMANWTDGEDGLWNTRPVRLNELNAPGIIRNFEDMLTRVKQQVGQDGTIEYVRKSTETETPDSNTHMKGLLRALNNYARSPEVPSLVNSPFDPTDDHNPPAHHDLFENSPELGSPVSTTGSPVKEVTQAVMRMALSSSPSQPPSPSGSAKGSKSPSPPPPALRVVNIADSDSGNSNSSPSISKPEFEKKASDDGNLGQAANPQQQQQQHKLRPHDPRQLPASYRNDPYRLGAVWERINWVPTAANQQDPGAMHLRGDPDMCNPECAEHPSTTLWEGVAAIMEADTSLEVGALLSMINHERLNYNFTKYGTQPFVIQNPDLNIRTVEFREAGGTLDGGDGGNGDNGRHWGWAQVWSRICVGIADWASSASVVEFLEVLDRIAEQEDIDQRGLEQDDAERYDVCDFLEDICLFAEAEWVRRREREMGPPR